MRTLLIAISVALGAVLLVGGVVFLIGYGTLRHEPQFYHQALQVEPAVQAEAGDTMERQVLELHNEARREGSWEAVFTDQQINGWLAVDLPQKFPQALPHGVSQPRVSITPDLARIACRCDSRHLCTVVVLAVAIQVVEAPNVVAVRIQNVRAGALPLPAVEKWKDKIEQLALNAGISLRWAMAEGQDVALLKLPTAYQGLDGRQICLETIELRDGEVYLAGRTEPVDDELQVVDPGDTTGRVPSEKVTVQR